MPAESESHALDRRVIQRIFPGDSADAVGAEKLFGCFDWSFSRFEVANLDSSTDALPPGRATPSPRGARVTCAVYFPRSLVPSLTQHARIYLLRLGL
jgi:hypothetical protein